MTVDLLPRHPDWEPYHTGSFSWSWMLRAGVGLPIGAADFVDAKSMWVTREVVSNGARYDVSPFDNSGFPVTALEAKAMAMAAWGLVQQQRLIAEEWNAKPEGERKRIEELSILDDVDPVTRRRIVRPVREDFIEKAERFAWFAFGSRGFRIY